MYHYPIFWFHLIFNKDQTSFQPYFLSSIIYILLMISKILSFLSDETTLYSIFLNCINLIKKDAWKQ